MYMYIYIDYYYYFKTYSKFKKSHLLTHCLGVLNWEYTMFFVLKSIE